MVEITIAAIGSALQEARELSARVSASLVGLDKSLGVYDPRCSRPMATRAVKPDYLANTARPMAPFCRGEFETGWLHCTEKARCEHV